MKKKLALIMVGVMMLSLLGGCGDDQQDQNQGESQIQTESGSTQDYETVLLKDVKVEDYVTIGDYMGLEMSFAAKESFTDEAVDELALTLYQVRDRAAKDGDTVNIDYVGTMDGVAFEGGTASGQQLALGSGSYIDGFEAGLVGVMPGETVDLNLSFPDPYEPNPDYSGKPCVFTVTVNYIYPTVDDTVMTDEGVAAMGSERFSTVQEMKDYCREYLEYVTEENYIAGKQNAAMDAVFTIAQVTSAPDELTQKYFETIYYSVSSQAAQYMMDADTFCTYLYGVDATTYVLTYAQEYAMQAMVIQYIANAEDLNISDEELETCIQAYAEKNKVTPEEVRASEEEESLREFFMFEKVLNFIVDNGVVTEVANEE